MPPLPRPRAALLAVALALVAAACGGDDATTSTTATVPATTPTTEPAPAPSDGQGAPATDAPAADFPVTVAHDAGEATIEDRPERIVSLSASLTEILYAVGAGDQVVAVDRYSTHPAEAPVTDLSGFRPSVEAIAAHEPDLVLLTSDRDGIVEALGAAGLPAVVLTSADGLDDTYRAIELVGTATGHPDEAATVVAETRARIEELAATVPDRDEPLRYYYELSGDLHSVTSATYVGELLSRAGLTSIADAAPDAAGGYPQLNAEFVLGADPDVIFLARTDGATPDPAEVAARPGWDGLAAVEEGRVVALDPDLASRWGPRVADLLAQVIEATAEVG